MPSAEPRRSAGKTALTIATELGIISAAAVPCTSRAAISIAMSWAVAASTVAARNPAAPARNIRRSPNRSPSLPPSTMNAASGSRFAVRIHWPSVSGPPRLLMMCGVASGTAV
jgi:hypothetical protein